MVKLERDKSLEVEFVDGFSKIIEGLRSLGDYSEAEISPEFLKLELHPSSRDLSAFAGLVYNKQNKSNGGSREWIKDYVFLCEGVSKKTGYRGVIYYRCKNSKRHHQIIIAHKGTHSSKDLEADFDGVAKNKLTPQINSCCTFVLDFLAKLKGDAPPSRNLKVQISATGHSLGGWLSQISAFALKYFQLPGKSETFELSRAGADIHPHCEVFDSPGAYQIIQKLASLPQFRSLKPKLHSTNFGLDVTTFVFSPNGVNVVNQHIGDMFLLPYPNSAENLILPSSYLSLSNLFYTKNTHKVDKFFESLEGLGDNGNPRICMVDEWILVLIRNWDSSYNSDAAHKFSKMFNMVGTAVLKFSSNVAVEYEDAIKSRMSSLKISNCPKLKININSLSYGVKEVLEILRTINILKNQVYNQIPSSLALPEIEAFLNILNEQENVGNSNILIIPGIEELNLLKNCGLLLPQIKEICSHLKNFELASCIYFSDKYVEELLGKFIKLEFGRGSNLEGANIILNCEEFVELTCFKIASCIDQEKFGLRSENTLLLRYSDVSHIIDKEDEGQISLAWLPPQIEHVFLNVNCDSRVISSVVGKLSGLKSSKLVCIFVDENSPDDEDPLEVKWNFEEILRQMVTFHGLSVPLSEIMGDNPAAGQQILKCLSSDAKKLSMLLEKNPMVKLEMGLPPPSIYNNINIYTEPFWRFRDLQEAMELFGGRGQGTILIYGEGSENLGRRWKADQMGLKIYRVKNGIDPVTNFKQLVAQDPSSIVDLLETNTHLLEWKLHYNPNLYMKRKIIPPAIDLKPLAQIEGLTFAKNADPRTGLEVLELRQNETDSFGKSGAIREKVLGQTFSETPSNYFNGWKCLRLKPEGDGACNISASGSDDEPLEWTYEPKGILEEDELLNENEGDFRELVCFSDAPGMGKSFLMASLSNKMLAKKNQQSKWVWLFFLELREIGNFQLINIPKDENQKLDNDELVAFFIHYLKLDEFRGLIFRNLFCSKNSSKLSFFLDGFDELPNEHKEKFCRILLHLRKYTNVGLTVSTRSRDNISIETSLGVLSHHLVPFEQFQPFLYNAWSCVIIKPEAQSRLRQFASSLLEKVSKSMTDDCQFLGIPLHLKMLSVSFQEPAYAYSTGVGDSLEQYLPPEYSFRTLLNTFIDTKYKLFFTKLGWQEGGGLHWNDLKPVLIYKFERELEFIAGSVLGLGSEFEELLWEARREAPRSSEFPPDLYRVGLVLKVGGKSEFLHRSIAEYYVGNCLYNCFRQLVSPPLKSNLKQELERFVSALVPVCRSAIFPTGSRLVRLFLDQLIEADPELRDCLKKGSLPLIVVPGEGVDNLLLECVYEVVRREYGSQFFFSFAINSFVDWNQISELVCLIMCLSSLTVIPMGAETLGCVFLLIHSTVVQRGVEYSILKLVKDQSWGDWVFGEIMDILRYYDGNMSWARFRYDLKAMLGSSTVWSGLRGELGEEGMEFMEVRMREGHGIGAEEFGNIVEMMDWLFAFIQKVKAEYFKKG